MSMKITVKATDDNITARLEELGLDPEEHPDEARALAPILDRFLNHGWVLAFRRYESASWVKAFPTNMPVQWPEKPPKMF